MGYHLVDIFWNGDYSIILGDNIMNHIVNVHVQSLQNHSRLSVATKLKQILSDEDEELIRIK